MLTTHIFRDVLCLALTLVVWCGAIPAMAADSTQPTARICALHGEAMVMLSDAMPVEIGDVLGPGDTIQTMTDATLTLELSDGSHLELGENTNVSITKLIHLPEQDIRISHIRLSWGWLRTTLAVAHQKRGSQFSIETPGALVGVKLSQPDIEVMYDPDTGMTTVFTHTLMDMVIV